ncbi:MAG: CRISPR-associated endoribonuclease Cas6 [Bacillota bacterium]|nr:CRISPR-associated endoribonuclease Cas6 [Bacillota bacterium]
MKGIKIMRFSIYCELEDSNMPLDYRRKLVSFFKYAVCNYDKNLYELLYGKSKNEPKDFCFSVYFPEAKIGSDEINIKSKKLIINISIYDLELGLYIYNSLIMQQWKFYELSTYNKIRISNIVFKKEKVIKTDRVKFKTLSPIVIRDHNKMTGKDWYLTFEDNTYEEILKRNLKSQLLSEFGQEVVEHINNLKIINVSMKKVIVKSYDINVACSIGSFILEGKQYLLNYFYKAGLGSKRGLGFSFLDIVE